MTGKAIFIKKVIFVENEMVEKVILIYVPRKVQSAIMKLVHQNQINTLSNRLARISMGLKHTYFRGLKQTFCQKLRLILIFAST